MWWKRKKLELLFDELRAIALLNRLDDLQTDLMQKDPHVCCAVSLRRMRSLQVCYFSQEFQLPCLPLGAHMRVLLHQVGLEIIEPVQEGNGPKFVEQELQFLALPPHCQLPPSPYCGIL